jgi:phage tail-like protein
VALIDTIGGKLSGALSGNRERLPAYRFRVHLDSATAGTGGNDDVAACSEVSGLECDLKTVEYQEGGNNDYIHSFRGQASFPKLVLKRGLMASDELWRWHQDVINGKVQRRNGAVTLLDAAGDEALRWSFTAAMPVKWSVPALNAATSALAFESVEFVHRGLTLEVLKK